MYEKELELAISIARGAGEIIQSIYGLDDLGVEIKSDESPVTLADKLANVYIIEHILEAYPDHAILSEESELDKRRFDAEYVWIIDPLDGTKEFIKRNDEFTINIALVQNNKPVVGVIYAPAIDELYFATQGGGSFFEKDGILTKNVISEKTHDLTIVCSRNRVAERIMRAFEKTDVGTLKKLGSSLKGCSIAKGEAEMYFSLGYTMEWDVCAMDLIVSEAGGIIRQGNDEPFTYNRQDNLNRHGFYIVNRIENKVI